MSFSPSTTLGGRFRLGTHQVSTQVTFEFQSLKAAYFLGDCEMYCGASPPSFLTCSTLKTRLTLRLLIISGVTRRDSGLKSETGL